ncbi:thiamine pyrophosphate-binding protein [Marivita hallyeonensis]|uniref:Acetolactate synthase-1/2/3 large subunit n=1 Tax=Marivita hallyeonensis TaxID=996342 RepID=A0A1M5PJN1_9RHOB|nr:thiamine pyrophosphate-binding protein [Marivita hallyeonensis]SHH02036.1 acetolactate synthase-1/2/3 large subunit [Marivita hallyeonensis]
MRGADHVMRTLAELGVRDIFALSGNQIMPLFDASLEAGIRLYHTRHEAAAVYMAEGYAQLAGGLGVALVTAGAGLGNAIGPLLTAKASDTPVLLLSGDSPVGKVGQGAFQEMDQVALTQSLTKWSTRPNRAEDVGAVIRKAARIAQSGRPGPVHVSLPADVLTTAADAITGDDAPQDAPIAVAEIQAWLRGASSPVIVLGPALSETRQPGLREQLADALDAPVIVMESPRGLNDPALGNLASIFDRADQVLLLGKPLDFTVQFGTAAPAASWAIVSGDKAEVARAKRNVGKRLDMALHQSPVETARHLARASTEPAHRSEWRAFVAKQTSQRVALAPSEDAILPDALCKSINAHIAKASSPVLICDGGEFGQWAQAGISAPRRIVNGVSGAIGGGLCYAMAARAADPNATVFALMGDGTVGFHLPEFETAVREDLPFVAVIGNDQSWNAEHQIQLRDFGPERAHGCTLSGARYDQAVEALGGFGAYVTDLSDLPSALDDAVASGKPACVNVAIKGMPAPTLT